MPDIGAYEAKTHLPKLLVRVKKGERFVITKHGIPVAELVPVGKRETAAVRKAIWDLRAFRKTLRKRGVRLSDLLGKGRRLRDLTHAGHRY
jgi:prevent-host-death family protein